MTADLTPVEKKPDTTTLNRIRVETALSRFPIHRLARKGNISIDLQHGAEFKWEVTYNTKHGQPGPLAYKLDTLIVNRRLDEASRPLPEIIKLGSLREICRDLGISDHDTELVKKAFHQNASAYITAKIRYKTRTGRERWTEIGYSRYSVVFTGEVLPDGATADAVYIVINASHRDLLNQVEARPLDYDYLITLSPGPQRFYELLSFQVYGAIASGRPRAKMLYSDYCRCAPQVRYPDFEHVKKQMFKIHAPHRKAGYIVRIDYQECADAEGQHDWEMLYTPGPKALAEFRAFSSRQIRHGAELSHFTTTETKKHSQPVQTKLQLADADDSQVGELTQRGITRTKALELLSRLQPGQELLDQLEYIDSIVAKAPRGKYHNPPGLYISVVQQNTPVPDSFVSSRKRQLVQLAQQNKNDARAKEAKLEMSYDEYRHNETKRFIREILDASEYQRLFNKSYEQNRRVYKQMNPAQLEDITQASVAFDLRESGQIKMLSIEEFRRNNLPPV